MGSYNIVQELCQIKLHSQAITSIDLTNSTKFCIVSIKNQGYFSCRVRKIKSKASNLSINYIFQELGNLVLNTIDTSSITNYNNNKEKLKIALEKRKECFNDLEEFRRELEVKSALNTKQLEVGAKRKELNFINETLDKI